MRVEEWSWETACHTSISIRVVAVVEDGVKGLEIGRHFLFLGRLSLLNCSRRIVD